MRARGLTRRFGKVVAVDQLDLDVQRGEVYGFLGPNGSGKSTTIRMLCGLLLPTAGEIRVLGMEIPRQAEALKYTVGYMTQKFALYDDLSVAENLDFVASIFDLSRSAAQRRIAELVELYQLGELRRQMAGTLSGGERQRLALAAAVLHQPLLLFLDEPTSAVDPQSRRDFWDSLFALADAGTTLLVSTHYMDEAERCHRLAILDHGRLVANGSPRALMESLPGATFLIESDTPRAVQQLVNQLPAVVASAQIGASLRVLARDGTDAAQLEHPLLAAGLNARVITTAANLEDVFVAATRRRQREGLGE
ncbi:MAG TPA: ABC transporter ATP-binding protein [Gammaproteobacteria bacterium]